jgi:hypothetical protein
MNELRLSGKLVKAQKLLNELFSVNAGRVCAGCVRRQKRGPFRLFESGTWSSSMWKWSAVT